jgi:acetolactate synthase-1/2/3 large subunit
VLPRVEPALAAPPADAMPRLRELLVAAERPFAIVGGSGWTAESCAALEQFAASWQLPVGCAFRFQDVFDNRHSCYAGDVGIGVSPQLAARIRDADLVVAIGARLGEMTTSGYELLAPPRPEQKLVHVHAGAEELGRVYAAELLVNAAMAHVGPALAALAPPATIRWHAWADALRADLEANRTSTPVEPLDMAEVVRAIDRHVPAEAVFTNGAGNFSGWLHRFHRYAGLRHAGRTQLAPTSGAMGYGLPAAVAAALLEPARTVVNLAGDGDFLMTSQEMATAIAYGAKRLVSIVVDNGSYGTIRMHQEREYPGRVSGSDLGNPDFAALARAFGWWAEGRVDRTADFEPALVAALAAGRPALIHVRLATDVITSRTSLAAIRRKAEARRAAEQMPNPL